MTDQDHKPGQWRRRRRKGKTLRRLVLVMLGALIFMVVVVLLVAWLVRPANRQPQSSGVTPESDSTVQFK